MGDEYVYGYRIFVELSEMGKERWNKYFLL